MKNCNLLQHRIGILLLDVFLSNPYKNRFPLGTLERRIFEFVQKEKRKNAVSLLIIFIFIIIACIFVIQIVTYKKSVDEVQQSNVYKKALVDCTAIGGRLVMKDENNIMVTSCDTIEVSTEASTLSGDCSREREFIKRYIREDYMRKVTGLER